MLNDGRLMDHLLDSARTNCFLLGLTVEEGEGLVNPCRHDDVPVDFSLVASETAR